MTSKSPHVSQRFLQLSQSNLAMIAERSSIISQSQGSQGSRKNNNNNNDDAGGDGGIIIGNDNNIHESDQIDIEKGTLLHTMDSTKKTHNKVLRETTAAKSALSNSPVKSSLAHQSNNISTVDKSRVVDLIRKSSHVYNDKKTDSPMMRKVSIQPPYQRQPTDTNQPHNNHNNQNHTTTASKVTFWSSMTEKFDHKHASDGDDNGGGGDVDGHEDEKAMEEKAMEHRQHTNGLIDNNSRQRGGRYNVGGNREIGDRSYH